MKIYLDDWRGYPIGFEVVRNYEDCIEMLLKNKNDLEVLSLDYDLDSIYTGFNVCEYLVENNIWPKEINIHSTHSMGRRMVDYLLEHAPADIKISYQCKEIKR